MNIYTLIIYPVLMIETASKGNWKSMDQILGQFSYMGIVSLQIPK